MKILIWIKKEDAISGNISEHHATLPQGGYNNYIQVEITQDYFVQLEDKGTRYSASIDGPGVEISNGRSQANYTYPEFIEKYYGKK